MSKFALEVEILSIGEEQFFGDFKKKEMVGLHDDGKYKTEYSFEFPNDKIDLLDSVMIGDKITVHFNLRSRKVEAPGKEDRYFSSLSAWRIEK